MKGSQLLGGPGSQPPPSTWQFTKTMQSPQHGGAVSTMGWWVGVVSSSRETERLLHETKRGLCRQWTRDTCLSGRRAPPRDRTNAYEAAPEDPTGRTSLFHRTRGLFMEASDPKHVTRAPERVRPGAWSSLVLGFHSRNSQILVQALPFLAAQSHTDPDQRGFGMMIRQDRVWWGSIFWG